MKTKVGFFSIVISTIIALGLRAVEAEDDAQATAEVTKKASIEADLERMKRTATQSCERLGKYLEKIEESEQDEQIPPKVYEVLIGRILVKKPNDIGGLQLDLSICTNGMFNIEFGNITM